MTVHQEEIAGLAAGSGATLDTPPMPPMLADGATGLDILRALRGNGYAAFPRECLRQPAMSLRALGRQVVVASSPQALGAILLGDSDAYVRMSVGRKVLQPIVGRGLLTSEGAAWRRQRRAMAPAFSPRGLPVLAGHILAEAERFRDGLERAEGEATDLLGLFRALALAIASRSMFSMESAAFDLSLRTLVTGYMTGLGVPRAGDFLLPTQVPTLVDLRRALFRRRWTRLIRGIVARRRAQPAHEARDLFDMMAAAYGSSDEALLCDEVATMIVAGHETTASTLFWATLLLARSPEWGRRVAAEAAGRDLVAEGAGALPTLPLTTAVVREAMRLYPPAFMSGREARRATTLCGLPVSPGALVLMPFWLTHRDPALWRDPDSFDPGRFVGQEPGRFAYLPFGAGPHVCIGAQLAMAEAVLVTAHLWQRFDVGLADTRPVLPVGTLATRPSRAPGFVLRRRSANGASSWA